MSKLAKMGAAALLPFGTIYSSAIAGSFEYIHLFHDRHVFSIQTESATVTSGDRAIDATFCAPASGFTCVESQWLSFAIPIAKEMRQSNWKAGKHVYKVAGHRHLVVFGENLNVIDIESKQFDRQFRFLYSTERGLVAFSAEVDGRFETFISQTGFGFGRQ